MIRSATLNDIPALHRLVNSAYRGEYSKQGWTTEADLLGGQRTDPEKLAEMIQTPGATIELLFETEALMGCVFLHAKEQHVYLGMLTVEPKLQDRGFGGELLKHAEGWARARGARLMKMTVIKGRDSLIAYYQRRGWELTGNTEPFPMDDPRFGLPKVPLTFLEMMKRLD